MSGWRPIASPTVSPGPVTTLRTPSGMPGLGAQLRDPEQAERRRRRRLDDDRVAGGERRAELPGGHLGRVVPRDDRRDDADRLAGDRRDHALRRGGDLAVELVDRLGVPPDAGGRLGHVEAHRVGDRLARVERLDDPQLAGVGLDEVGPAEEHALAVAGVEPAPATVVRGPPCGRDGRVDVRGATTGDLRELAARGRVLGREAGAAGRVAELAVDEQLGPEREPVDRRGRLRLVGDQRVGHRGASGWIVRSRRAG